MFDVLVIGGGLAGLTAALAAHREGAKVALSSRSWGATAMSTGALDIAYSPALSPVLQGPRTLSEHVLDIIAHRKRHPYGVLGVKRSLDGIAHGYAQLRSVLEGTDLALDALDFDADNAAYASSLGVLMPAATAFGPHRGGNLASAAKGKWGVLSFLGDPNFDARRVRIGVSHDLEQTTDASLELVEVPVTLQAGSPLAMARRFDDQQLADDVARELATKAKGLDGLIASPVLGLSRTSAVRAKLSDAVGAPVVEALAHLPSVPGIRLQRELDSVIERTEFSCVGEMAEPLVGAGGALLGGRTTDQLDVRAGAVVLATGRFVSGGVQWDPSAQGSRGRCCEALFGLPVVSELGPMEDDSPISVVRETPVESHPLMTAGVAVNEALQPMREGGVAWNNLFAAGMVIGGYASRYALCADGVALATGWYAGQAAAGVTP